jgi:hypothetical protein
MALTLALGSVALAGPKDKTQEALINPTDVAGNASWDNTVVATKVKTGKCKVQIQFKDASGVEGQEVICLGEADVISSTLAPPGAGNGVVMKGIVSGGKLKIKGKMTGVGCGSEAAITLNSAVTCYEEDPTYDPAVACASMPGLWVPQGSIVEVKPDSIVGLCQGVTLGARIAPPASPLLAVQGMLSQAQ